MVNHAKKNSRRYFQISSSISWSQFEGNLFDSTWERLWDILLKTVYFIQNSDTRSARRFREIKIVWDNRSLRRIEMNLDGLRVDSPFLLFGLVGRGKKPLKIVGNLKKSHGLNRLCSRWNTSLSFFTTEALASNPASPGLTKNSCISDGWKIIMLWKLPRLVLDVSDWLSLRPNSYLLSKTTFSKNKRLTTRVSLSNW